MKNKITFLNRYTSKLEEELVYGGDAIEWLYNSGFGSKVRHFITGRLFSSIYGSFQNTRISSSKVPGFLKKFKINQSDYKKGSVKGSFENSFESFNEFFIREFQDGKRSFPQENKSLGAPAEARYFGIENIKKNDEFPVKGIEIDLKELLGDAHLAEVFEGGSLLIARLCPVDYHRYHYPDNGQTVSSYFLHGPLDSVNPIALELDTKILFRNERQVNIFETQNFGKLAYIEVGATCVGKILQSHQEDLFSRGDEKGYFLFGGSTVILIGQKNKWAIDSDILKNTQNGHETYIHLGDQIGYKIN